ncbi:predicted protein [Uncinocarpus reesii 1704]|uniref:Uncharacterized protein n=1 Tax=Uncinocarpus reesii (strain UAMH 1704) TaxID=336963 RepID=C4JM98_UNCRE|nr:uncharacterized protein UREG_03956 [Uncinocarpus reesii 1704]EEP79110.1 predicted protein [Uncinocarpus reesii 1704]
MAAVTQPISPASRQPFAVLSDTRLRAVESAKNHQNGLRSSSLKRPLDVSDLSDAENVDPASMESPTKRSKLQLSSGMPKSKAQSARQPSSITAENTARSLVSTPVLPRALATSTPRSAPLRAAAGRSPRSKVAKTFARRSAGFCRVDPRSFSKRHAGRAPFSISDALAGTFSLTSFNAEKSKSGSGSSRRKAWDFEIHVDSEQDEMANLMEHGTCMLDISDDESKGKDLEREKENIPPPDFASQVTPLGMPSRAFSSPDEMTDGPRSPLGELDPKDFIPEGEDASTSVIQILEDEEDDLNPSGTSSTSSEAPPARRVSSTPQQAALLKQAVISSLIKSTTPVTSSSKMPNTPQESASSAVETETEETASPAGKTAESDGSPSRTGPPVAPSTT